MADDARADATPIEVISQNEALQRERSGGFLANGQRAPEAAAVDMQSPPPGGGTAPSPRAASAPPPAAAAKDDDSFWSQYEKPAAKAAKGAKVKSTDPDEEFWGQYGEPDAAPPAKAAPVKKQSGSLWRSAVDHIGNQLYAGAQGLGGATTEFGGAANTIAAPLVQSVETWKDLLSGKIHSLNQDAPTEWQDAWFKHTVDPTVEHAQDFATDESSSFAEKASHAVGATLGYLAQAILTGGAGETAPAVTTVKSGMELAGDVAAHGIKSAQAPAVTQAVNVGREAYKSTNDAELSFKLAAITYSSSVEQNMLPLAMPGKVMTRMATGGGMQLAGGEASREATNAVIPDEHADMRQPFSAEGAVLNLAQGAVMGGVGGPRLDRMPHQAVEKPQNIMEHAQIVAAAEAKAAGGDELDQAVAAAHANAVLSAHHDAAAYEAHMESQHQRVTEENAVADQQAEQQAREDALNQAANEKAAPVAPATLFERREQEQAAQKDKDFTAAKNQKGDQEVARGETLAAGVEKGEEGFEKPKLLDTLSPEQAQAFKTLKERRAAEGSQEDTKSVTERLKAQNPEDNFTPYVEPKGNVKVTEGASEAPESNVKVAEAEERPLEGDSWKAPTGATVEVLKDHGDGTYTVRTTPADSSQVPRRRKVSEAALNLMKSTAEPVEAPQTLGERREAAGVESVAQEAPAEPAVTAEAVDTAAKDSAYSPESEKPTPTQAQYEAGNYQKGHVDVQGMPVTIEHPAGTTRPSGAEMAAHYGYVKGTVAADGQHVDIMIGKHPENDTHFIVDHLNDQGYEQAKVLTGFANRLEALRAYRKAYPENPMGPVSEVKTPTLKEWLKNGDTTKPFDQKGVNRLADTRFADTAATPRTLADRRSGTGSEPLDMTKSPEERALQRENAAARRRAEDGQQTPFEPEPIPRRAAETEGEAVRRDAADPNQPESRARDTATPDRRAGRRLTRDETTEALKPLTDKIGDEGVQVHEDKSTLPDNIKSEMSQFNHPNPRGVYDPSTDTVHIVAAGHVSADEALRTAVHEIVGHQGVRRLFDKVADYRRAMQDIYDNIHDRAGAMGSPMKGVNKATAKTWMKDYMSQHGLDARNPRHQQLAIDEYIAHLAEHDFANNENPSLLRRAIDAVRSGLRKLGAVREWTDDDIRHLLRKSASNLAAENSAIRENAQWKNSGPRFADEIDRLAERFAADHPLAIAHKFGKTMEDQANYNPGFVRKRMDWMRDKWGDTQDSRLAFIGLRNLKDFMDQKLMPSLHSFIRVHDQMDGRRGSLMQETADKARDWSRYVSKDKVRGGALGELMHASTLGGVDPSKLFDSRYSEEEKAKDPTKQAHDGMRSDLHARLKEVYNKQLDDKGREIFNTIRDHYVRQRQQVFDALQTRIEQSGADANTKKQIMAELRLKFEASKVQGPYFPLARFGDHWASAKDSDGNTVSFSRFESKSQKNAWIENAKKLGYDVDAGQRMDDKSMMERIDPKFVQKVTELVKNVDPALADEVWQEYLKAMPEMSMRKHFIHRVGRLGFTMDALRAFAHNSFHGAHQLARLEYGNRLDGILDNVKTEAQNLNSKDPTSSDAAWASSLARELGRRYDWIKNPRSSPLSSAITKFGFGWYLGAAPATAFRILSQNPMLAAPMLAKFHGPIGATRELSKASAQWAMAKGSLGDTLRGNERRAFDTANDMGVFSNTATQNLANGGSGKPMFTGPAYHISLAAGFLFNAMEHHNRMTTYLAAYRLGVKSGMAHDDAVNHANDLTWDSHFDYTNANRPRVLQNDFAKVALLFKQYSWGVTYRLAREFRDTINSKLPAQQRAGAAMAFGGLLGRQMLFSGVTGLPLYWIAESVVNAVMGDKDKPFEMTAAIKKQLADSMGQTASDSIMTGAVGAATGASLSGGSSYNDLWYRPPARDETAPQQWSDLTGQMLGAIPAIGTNMATGAMMMHDGQIERGFEHFLPPEAAAVMKAIRYSKEGATNLRGEQVISRDEMDDRDIFLQSIGFTPQKVADAYARNTALKNVSKAIVDRREQIINHVAVASSMGDSDEIDKAMAEASHFDDTNPGLAINAAGLVNAARNLLKNQAESVNGVKLPPGLSGLYDTYGKSENQ